jgi:hypothetical protein
LAVEHAYVSTLPEGSSGAANGGNLVSATEWNAAHVIKDLWSSPLTTSTALAAPVEHVKVNGGSGTQVAITLPDATIFTNSITIKRVDAGTTAVLINCVSSQTIDGLTTWELVNPMQYITVSPDGANWMVKANN